MKTADAKKAAEASGAAFWFDPNLRLWTLAGDGIETSYHTAATLAEIDAGKFAACYLTPRQEDSDYLSTTEAGLIVGLSGRRIQALCVAGRVVGARRWGGDWQIPQTIRIRAGARGPAPVIDPKFIVA